MEHTWVLYFSPTGSITPPALYVYLLSIRSRLNVFDADGCTVFSLQASYVFHRRAAL